MKKMTRAERSSGSDLIAVVVHGHQTQEMAQVATLSQFAGLVYWLVRELL